jgi:hypothetical protein
MQDGLRLTDSQMHFHNLSDLINSYRSNNPELPYILKTHPSTLHSASMAASARVAITPQTRVYYLGGVPQVTVRLAFLQMFAGLMLFS